MENWKPILGYEGCYEVSDHGRVRSLARKDTYGSGRPVSQRILKISMGGCRPGFRYPQVTLRRRSQLVHSLVMQAFVGPPPPGMQVCHKDGNRLNNKLSNLRYGTSRSNADDRAKHGRWKPVGTKGEAHPNSKVTEDEVRAIRAWPYRKPGLRKQWPHIGESTIGFIRSGRSWKHVVNPKS